MTVQFDWRHAIEAAVSAGFRAEHDESDGQAFAWFVVTPRGAVLGGFRTEVAALRSAAALHHDRMRRQLSTGGTEL